MLQVFLATVQDVAGGGRVVGNEVVLSWASLASIATVVALAAGAAATYLRLAIMSDVEQRLQAREERLRRVFMSREVLEERFKSIAAKLSSLAPP